MLSFWSEDPVLLETDPAACPQTGLLGGTHTRTRQAAWLFPAHTAPAWDLCSVVDGQQGSGMRLAPGRENPTDRGTWQAAVYGAAKSRTRLSNYHTRGGVRRDVRTE